MKSTSLQLHVDPRQIRIAVPMTSEACFKAAGAIALLGVLLWLSEQ